MWAVVDSKVAGIVTYIKHSYIKSSFPIFMQVCEINLHFNVCIVLICGNVHTNVDDLFTYHKIFETTKAWKLARLVITLHHFISQYCRGA